jgi:hypothetical protein
VLPRKPALMLRPVNGQLRVGIVSSREFLSRRTCMVSSRMESWDVSLFMGRTWDFGIEMILRSVVDQNWLAQTSQTTCVRIIVKYRTRSFGYRI